jgi:DNA invertase Pin-like site-specific DNA recombinase
MPRVERDLIRTRTAEGRSRAKARGQHMGRPPKLTDVQKAEARQRRAEGATLKELALSYNVARATISRLQAERPKSVEILHREMVVRPKPFGFVGGGVTRAGCHPNL